MKMVLCYFVCLQFAAVCGIRRRNGELFSVHVSSYDNISNQTHIMENEEKNETPVPAPAPTTDACDRLTAARKYACEQYEKLCTVASEQMDSVRHYTEQARRQVNEGWDVTCSKAKELHKAGEAYVKENPTGSVLGALGVGVLVGLLLGVSKR